MLTEITEKFNNTGTRNSVRKKVVMKFMDETKGNGKGALASNYKYYVEKLDSGNKIYLKRPAWNYYGFDFIVCIENYVFSNGKENPKHDDIIQDLHNKKNQNSKKYSLLYEEILNVFNCNKIKTNINEKIQYTTGFTAEMILKTLKWFFIEQDIRYWNYSGREMLMKAINEI